MTYQGTTDPQYPDGLAVASPADCRDKCAARSNCVAYHYTTTNKICVFKTTETSKDAAPDMISGKCSDSLQALSYTVQAR